MPASCDTIRAFRKFSNLSELVLYFPCPQALVESSFGFDPQTDGEVQEIINRIAGRNYERPLQKLVIRQVTCQWHTSFRDQPQVLDRIWERDVSAKIWIVSSNDAHALTSANTAQAWAEQYWRSMPPSVLLNQIGAYNSWWHCANGAYVSFCKILIPLLQRIKREDASNVDYHSDRLRFVRGDAQVTIGQPKYLVESMEDPTQIMRYTQEWQCDYNVVAARTKDDRFTSPDIHTLGNDLLMELARRNIAGWDLSNMPGWKPRIEKIGFLYDRLFGDDE